MPRKVKGQRTQEKILRSAIYCLANLGYDKTTFQAIADHCGISQPLVVHYFKKKENVFPEVIEYLIQQGRRATSTETMSAGRPADRLREYLRIAVKSVKAEPDMSRVFLTVSYLATVNENFRQINSRIKQLSINQITDILAAGIREREFDIAEVTLTARMINSYLMGVLIDLMTDDHLVDDEKRMLKGLEATCLALVGYRPVEL